MPPFYIYAVGRISGSLQTLRYIVHSKPILSRKVHTYSSARQQLFTFDNCQSLYCSISKLHIFCPSLVSLPAVLSARHAMFLGLRVFHHQVEKTEYDAILFLRTPRFPHSVFSTWWKTPSLHDLGLRTPYSAVRLFH